MSERDCKYRLCLKPKTPIANAKTEMGTSGRSWLFPDAVRVSAVTVRVVVALAPADGGVNVFGLNEHAAPAGKPEQEKVMGLENPVRESTEIVTGPVPPDGSASDVGATTSPKLDLV